MAPLQVRTARSYGPRGTGFRGTGFQPVDRPMGFQPMAGYTHKGAAVGGVCDAEARGGVAAPGVRHGLEGRGTNHGQDARATALSTGRAHATGLRTQDSGLSTGLAAFTLVELTVSIGILALMLALAGAVFKWTLDSTGQAQALTDINEQLRRFEAEIRDDLANVDPANSLMLLQTNFANAYWTNAGREVDGDRNPLNGYPHPSDPERENPYLITDAANNPWAIAQNALMPPRADILMFFTSRPGHSYKDPTQHAYIRQVVYGHADIGTLNAAGMVVVSPGDYFFNPDPGTPNPDPIADPTVTFGAATTSPHVLAAQDWHLARRSVLISNLPDNPANADAWLIPQIAAPGDPQAAMVPVVVTDAISAWKDEDLVGGGLGHDTILDGGCDLVGRFVGTLTAAQFEYHRSIVGLTPATPDPTLAAPHVPIPQTWYGRTRLDPTPPPRFANRIGPYLMPNCASFKVEWTATPNVLTAGSRPLDLDRAVWFDMQNPNGPFWEIDPANLRCLQLEPQNVPPIAIDSDANGQSDIAEALDKLHGALQGRFVGPAVPPTVPPTPDIHAATPIWYATNPHLSIAGGTLDPFFPTALRITVDVFDPNNRFERPIRHVIVAKVGS